MLAKRKIPPLRPPGTVDSMEAAQLLGVSKSTFFRYRQEPDFPQPVQVGRGGRESLYRSEDILAWKAKREGQAEPPATP